MPVPFSVASSTKPNVDEAIEEAFSEASRDLDGGVALLIAYLSYSKYPNHEAVKKALRKAVGEAPFIGISTAGEYVNDSALSKSVVIALLSNKYFTASVGASSNANVKPREAGLKAVKDALKNLKAPLPANPLKPSVIALMHSVPGREEDVLIGVREGLGRHVAIVGGSSGDDFMLKPPLGYQVSSAGGGVNSVVVALIATKLSYEVMGGHACKATGKAGLVTKAGGAREEVIEEIDGAPALRVYAEWLGLDEGRVRKEILALGLSSPLALKDPVTGEYYIKHPAMVVGEAGVGCFASVPKNHVVHLMSNDLSNAVDLGAKLASEVSGEPVGALLIHCAGLTAYIGERRAEFAKKLHESLGKAPLVGLAAYGEQWGYKEAGTESVHNNLTTALLVFTKQ